jgi:hypothetical protein
MEQNINTIVFNNNRKNLIITRNLGHKIDIPGSGQWKFFTDESINDKDCWICDK